MVAIDRTERRIVAEKLSDQGTLLAHIIHEMWRVRSVHREGLTPGEVKHLEKTSEMLDECLDRMRVINQRARK